MPKISDARRRDRRAQILEAARGCFLRQGLHPTTMDDIVRASGLSAGAVYGYFSGKDELIVVALVESMTRLGERLLPLLTSPRPPAPAALIGTVAAVIDALSAEDGVDLRRIAVLGWAEAQRNPRMREEMRGFYEHFRAALVGVATHWRAAGLVSADAEPADVAAVILALAFGHVAQAAVLGAAAPERLAAGLEALLRPATPGVVA